MLKPSKNGSGAPTGPKTDRMSTKLPLGNMKSSMPFSASKGDLPKGNSNETASVSGVTAYKKGGSVKMPTTMPRKSAC